MRKEVLYYTVLALAVVVDAGCVAGWVVHNDLWAYVTVGRGGWGQVAILFGNVATVVMVWARAAYLRAMRYPRL